MMCTGLKKCIPVTRSGCSAASAISEIGSDDVFVASSACAGACAARSPKMVRLSSRFSGAASTMPARTGRALYREVDLSALGRRRFAAISARQRRWANRIAEPEKLTELQAALAVLRRLHAAVASSDDS